MKNFSTAPLKIMKIEKGTTYTLVCGQLQKHDVLVELITNAVGYRRKVHQISASDPSNFSGEMATVKIPSADFVLERTKCNGKVTSLVLYTTLDSDDKKIKRLSTLKGLELTSVKPTGVQVLSLKR